LSGVEFGFLGQKPHSDVLAQDGLSGIGAFLPADDAEQGAFALSVSGHQCYFFALGNAKGNARQHGSVMPGFGYVFDGQVIGSHNACLQPCKSNPNQQVLCYFRNA